ENNVTVIPTEREKHFSLFSQWLSPKSTHKGVSCVESLFHSECPGLEPVLLAQGCEPWTRNVRHCNHSNREATGQTLRVRETFCTDRSADSARDCPYCRQRLPRVDRGRAWRW